MNQVLNIGWFKLRVAYMHFGPCALDFLLIYFIIL